jgi:ADP-ribosylglycohydrolase
MKHLEQVQAPYLRRLVRDELKLRIEQGQTGLPTFEQVSHAGYTELLEIEAAIYQSEEAQGLDIKEPLNWRIPDLRVPEWSPSEEELKNRIAGAWYGRIAGCVLGKPVERGEFMQGFSKLHEYLRRTGQFPLTDFVENVDDVAIELVGGSLGSWKSQKPHLQYAESDDDLRYTYMGLEILEKYGSDFHTGHVYGWWAGRLTTEMTFTAEQAAIANAYRLDPHAWGNAKFSNEEWEFIRRYRNPYREWIGAAIRADGWAYCAAGDPVRAGQYAQKDARLSHERNGEYSEIFFAAWIAGAFSMSLEESFEVALQLIPAESRLAHAVIDARRSGEKCESFETMIHQLHERYGHFDGVHAINNAVACVGAAFFAKGDYETAITVAVMFGWDTDCNGATVGSLLGAQLGYGKLPLRKWIQPLNDKIDLEIPYHTDEKISELVNRYAICWKKLSGLQ